MNPSPHVTVARVCARVTNVVSLFSVDLSTNLRRERQPPATSLFNHTRPLFSNMWAPLIKVFSQHFSTP